MRKTKKPKSVRSTYLGNQYGCRADGTPITKDEAIDSIRQLQDKGLIRVTPMPKSIKEKIKELLDKPS